MQNTGCYRDGAITVSNRDKRFTSLVTVQVEIYAGTFFRGFKGANVKVCTNIRGSAPDYPSLSLYIRLTQVFTFTVRG